MVSYKGWQPYVNKIINMPNTVVKKAFLRPRILHVFSLGNLLRALVKSQLWIQLWHGQKSTIMLEKYKIPLPDPWHLSSTCMIFAKPLYTSVFSPERWSINLPENIFPGVKWINIVKNICIRCYAREKSVFLKQ